MATNQPPPIGGTPPAAPPEVAKADVKRVRARRHLAEEDGGKLVTRAPGEVFEVPAKRVASLGKLIEDATGAELGLPVKKK